MSHTNLYEANMIASFIVGLAFAFYGGWFFGKRRAATLDEIKALLTQLINKVG